MEYFFYKYSRFVVILVIAISVLSGVMLSYLARWDSVQSGLLGFVVFLTLIIPVALKMHGKPPE